MSLPFPQQGGGLAGHKPVAAEVIRPFSRNEEHETVSSEILIVRIPEGERVVVSLVRADKETCAICRAVSSGAKWRAFSLRARASRRHRPSCEGPNRGAAPLPTRSRQASGSRTRCAPYHRAS